MPRPTAHFRSWPTINGTREMMKTWEQLKAGHLLPRIADHGHAFQHIIVHIKLNVLIFVLSRGRKSSRLSDRIVYLYVFIWAAWCLRYEFQPPKSCKSHGTVLIKHLDFVSRHVINWRSCVASHLKRGSLKRCHGKAKQRRAEPLPLPLPLFVRAITNSIDNEPMYEPSMNRFE